MSVNKTLAYQVGQLRDRTQLPFAVGGWSTRGESHWRLLLAKDLEHPDFWNDVPAGPVVPKSQLPTLLNAIHHVLNILDGTVPID